jgi:DNA topoisomerase-3
VLKIFVGTDATIHEHIKKIIDREYVFKDDRGYFVPSTLGVGLVEGYDSIGFEKSLSKPNLRREVSHIPRLMYDCPYSFC